MKNKGTIWLTLFILYACYVASELYLFDYFILNPQDDLEPVGLLQYIHEAVMLIILVGFYGYISTKKIINVVFWRALFLVIVGSIIFEITSGIQDYGVSYFDIYIESWQFMLLYVAIIPAIVSIYMYSFKSNKVWL